MKNLVVKLDLGFFLDVFYCRGALGGLGGSCDDGLLKVRLEVWD